MKPDFAHQIWGKELKTILSLEQNQLANKKFFLYAKIKFCFCCQSRFV